MAYKYQTFADLLYTSYSGLQMLAFAFGKAKNRCDKDCYAFRQSVIRKLKAGEMKIGDLYQNIIRQMTSPHDACWYCGRSVSDCGPLTADHIFPRMKGGEDISDNLIMVCRSCNSSKGVKDLLAWYHERGEFPPLRVLVHYLKLVNQYAIDNSLLGCSLDELDRMELPFDFHYLPRSYPQPEEAQETLPSRNFQLKMLGPPIPNDDSCDNSSSSCGAAENQDKGPRQDLHSPRWAEHGRFCIEDAAIMDDHHSSWIARYLDEVGFRDDTPEGYHRDGPWLWVDVNSMTYRYHPRYGVGYGTPIGEVNLTGEDFRTIWSVIANRRKVNAEIAGGWEERIKRQTGKAENRSTDRNQEV